MTLVFIRRECASVSHRYSTPCATRISLGFTLVELLVVIAVIVILIALVLPMIGMARGKSRQTHCASNQVQIYSGWTAANSRDRRRPVRGSQWNTRIEGYLSNQKDVLFCPDDTTRAEPSSFGFNAHSWRFGAPDAGRIVLLDYKQMEAVVVGSTVAQLEVDWPALQAPRHFLRENVMFADGHVGSYEPAQIDPQFCDYYVRYWRPLVDTNVQLTSCVLSRESAAAIPIASGTTTGGTTADSTSGASSTTSGAATGYGTPF